MNTRLQLLVTVLTVVAVVAGNNHVQAAYVQEVYNTPFEWLNDFFAPRTLGKYTPVNQRPNNFAGFPGLCRTSKPQDTCLFNFADVPQSIKDASIDLSVVGLSTSINLGSVLNSGSLEVTFVEIKDLTIGNVVAPNTLLTSNATHASIAIRASGVKFSAKADFEIDNLKIPNPLGGTITGGARGTIFLNKASQLSGNNVNLTVILAAPSGLNLNVPTDIQIPVSGCGVKLDLGISFDPLTIKGGIFQSGNIGAQASAIINIITPVIDFYACDIISQLAQLKNGSDGFIGQILNKTGTEINGYVSTLPSNTAAVADAAAFNALNATRKNDTIQFTGENFKIVNKLIQNFLGNGNAAQMNTIVESITGTTDGSFSFDEITAAGAKVALDLQALLADIEIISIAVVGLNTFERFQLLNNPSNFKYTLNHTLQLDTVKLDVLVQLKLDNGAWESSGIPLGSSAETVRFKLRAELKDLQADLLTLTALAPNQLLSRQVGQLLGGLTTPTTVFSEQVLYSVQCAAPALYNLSFPSMVFRVGDLQPPIITEFDDIGVQPLITNVVSSVFPAVKGAIVNRLAGISQQFVRPFLNKFIQKNVIGRASNCIPFVPELGEVKLFNFQTSNLFGAAERIVNEVVGGNPVETGPTGINQIVRLAVNALAEKFSLNMVESAPGTWFLMTNVETRLGTIGVSNVGSILKFPYIKLENVNSISRTLLTATGDRNFNFNLSIGNVPTPLKIKAGFDLNVVYLAPATSNSVNSKIEFQLEIPNLAIDFGALLSIDMNALFQLKLSELIKARCILASLKDADIGANVNLGNVKILFFVNSTSTPTSPFDSALTTLNLELQNVGNQARMNSILKTVIKSSLNLVTGFINNHDFASSKITVRNCADFDPGFGNVIGNAIFQLLNVDNVTALIQQNIGVQPPMPSVETLNSLVVVKPGTVFFDWDDSLLGGIIPSILKQFNNQQLRDLFNNLASGGADSFAGNNFKIDPQDGNVTFTANLSSLLNISLDGLVDGGRIIVQNISVKNFGCLDVNNLKILDPVADFVLNNSISFPENLGFQIAVTIEVPGSFLASNSPILRDTMVLSVNLKKLLIDIVAIAAINNDQFSKFTLGNFITVNAAQEFSINTDGLQCVLAMFYDNGLFLPKLEISMESIGKLNGAPFFSFTHGIVSPGVQGLLNAVFQLIIDISLKDLKNISQGAIRNFLNELVLKPLINQPGTCPTPIAPPLNGENIFLNFQTSNIVQIMNRFIRDVLAGSNNQYRVLNGALNALFNSFVLFGNEPFKFLDNFKASYKAGVVGFFDLYFGQIKLKNLGTVNNLELFKPVSKNNASIAIGLNGPTEFSLVVNIAARDFFVDKDVRNDAKFTFIFEDVDFELGLFIKLNLINLMRVEASALTDLSQISCALTAIEEFGFSNYEASIGKFESKLECVGVCNSAIAGPIQNGGSVSLNKIVDIIIRMIDFVLQYALTDKVLGLLNGQLEDSEQQCGFALDLSRVEQTFNPEIEQDYDFGAILGIAFLGGVFASFFLVILAAFRHKANKARYLEEAAQHYESLPDATPKSVAIAMSKEQIYVKSLAFHPNIPLCYKICVPSALVINVICLVMCVYVIPNFDVSIKLTVGGDVAREIILVPFSIQSTVNNMYNSGALPLALLIGIGSALWPIAKNLYLLFIWFAPTTILGKHKKEHHLEILDMLGKWSMIDIFVVVIVVGVLRFEIPLTLNPNFQGVISADTAKVDILCTPVIGIILLSIAALLSLAINHVIIYWNERSAFLERRLFKKLDGATDLMLTGMANEKFVIKDYLFSTKNSQGQHDRFTSRTKNILIYLSCLNIVFLVILMAIPAYKLEYHGFIALLVKAVDVNFDYREFSMFEIGAEVLKANKGTFISWAVVIFFMAVYYISVILAPYIQVILYLWLWTRPVTYNQAKWIFMFANIAFYWESVEIFGVSILAASTEVGHIAEFMMDVITGGVCGAGVPTFEKVFEGDEGKCLYIKLFLGGGTYLCIPVAIWIGIVTGFILRGSRVAIRDREFILESTPLKDRYSYTKWERRFIKFMMPHSLEHHIVKDGGHGGGGGARGGDTKSRRTKASTGTSSSQGSGSASAPKKPPASSKWHMPSINTGPTTATSMSTLNPPPVNGTAVQQPPKIAQASTAGQRLSGMLRGNGGYSQMPDDSKTKSRKYSVDV